MKSQACSRSKFDLDRVKTLLPTMSVIPVPPIILAAEQETFKYAVCHELLDVRILNEAKTVYFKCSCGFPYCKDYGAAHANQNLIHELNDVSITSVCSTHQQQFCNFCMSAQETALPYVLFGRS